MEEKPGDRPLTITLSATPEKLVSEIESISDVVERAKMDMDSGECTLKRDTDEEEELMEPLSVLIKSEPDFEVSTEETIMEEKFEATESTPDIISYEFAREINEDGAEVLLEPVFVPVKTELDFEETSEETTVEENCEAADIIKGSCIETNQQPHIECSAAPCSSQIDFRCTQSSSIEVKGMYNRNQFWGNDFSLEHGIRLVERSQCQRPFAVASSSTAQSRDSQEEAADRYMLEEHEEEQAVGVSQEQHADQRWGVNNDAYRGACFQEEMLGSALLKKTCEKSKSELGKRAFECITCNKIFSHKSTFDQHMQIHSGERPFKCYLCGKSYTRGSSLTTHMRIHSGEKPFTCSYCGKCFTTSSVLTVHTRMHTADRPYRCAECEKSFKRNDELVVHMRTHTGEKPFICNLCGKALKSSVNLSSHMRTHSGERPFKCSECWKSFTERSNLAKHMRIHTGEKPFKCNQCGVAFKRSDELTSHMRTHTGEKPFQCPECGKCFTGNSALSKHMCIHTGCRQHICSACGKAFIQKAHLTKHMQRHTGEVPFRCDECGNSFKTCDELTSHMITHSGERPL